MGLRRSSDRSGTPRQRLLNTHWNGLRGCTGAKTCENGNHEQARAEGESAFQHNLFLRGREPQVSQKAAGKIAREFAARRFVIQRRRISLGGESVPDGNLSSEQRPD